MRSRNFILTIVLTTLLLLGSSALAQTLPSPKLELPQFSNTNVRTASVRLDGRELFQVAVPANGEANQPNQKSAIQLRVEGIEANLNRLADQSGPLEVTSTIDTSSNLPIIRVNNQYLMTVTTLDAQLQGQEPATYAENLTRTIQEGLTQAGRERQPDFMAQQAGKAIAILLGGFVLSWLVSRLQAYLREQQRQQHTKALHFSELPPNTPEMASSRTQLLVKQQLENRQQSTMKDVRRRSLQLVQLIIWAAGGYTILGLFPQSRSLQPLVLSTPLKVLGVIVLTYLLIRLSELVIDRLFSALDIPQQSPDISQRVALRVSTFSRVVKGLSTLIWISISLITILAILGIQILPLLAGAGIIGLGISLASQNLIKDVINGFLILLEDQYAVGDVIQVGTMSGLVESISLRITQIRNSEGRLITIPNSAISIVENLSKDWSRVDLSIAIAFDADVDRAIHLIEKVGQDISHDPDWQTKILESPQVLGVENISNEGVTIRIWIKTQPLQQWYVGREFRKRLKRSLDAEGISIGIPLQAFSVRGAIDNEIFDHQNSETSNPQQPFKSGNHHAS